MKTNIEFNGDLLSVGSEQLLRKFNTIEKEHEISTTPELTGSFQLVIAGQILSKHKINLDDQFSPPFNWNDETWRIMCLEDYHERLLTACVFMVMEYDRIRDMEAKGEEWNPTKKQES